MRLPRILQSSIDAFEEAVDHYIEGTPKSNKSCIEYCDKANELILKAKVQDLGEWIEVKKKRGGPRSLYIHESLDILRNKKGIKIREHDRLIEIHKRRNPTYHRGEPVTRARTRSVLKTTY
ncbi:MAG: hypothetical protein M3261_06765, partial [Thermoproteota archaeon]|nr:hypothetical protein [Thermoproteota archaeon]